MGVNEVTRGVGWFGDLAVKDGQVKKAIAGYVKVANVAGNVAVIGHLPAGATITDVRYMGSVDSNAATSAALNVGYADGAGNELIAAADLKADGSGEFRTQPPTGDLAADHVVTGVFAKVGNGTAGGPWLVVVEFLSNPKTNA